MAGGGVTPGSYRAPLRVFAGAMAGDRRNPVASRGAGVWTGPESEPKGSPSPLIRTCAAAAFAICLAISSAVRADTGPGALAAPGADDTAVTRPRRLMDNEAFLAMYPVRKRATETTAAFTRRRDGALAKVLSRDPRKLDPDTDYWHMLSYLREVPWKAMPAARREFYLKAMPNPRLTDEQRAYLIKGLSKRKLFTFTPKELDLYLGHMRKAEPDLRARIVKLARQSLGQPYAIYLLGEFPHEVYDADPTFDLAHGDCVVQAEHMYAMALSDDWKSFYRNLQKIRYKNGVVGMTTRNHSTEADWDINNRWLVTDATNDLGATTVTKYTEKIDRAAFFRNFGIGADVPVEMLEDTYIPAAAVPSVLSKLKDGDFVNVVRGNNGGVWVGHVGLIGHKPDGTVTFLHSTDPVSKEQPIMKYAAKSLKRNAAKANKGKAQFLGFKFLRLRAEEFQKPQ